MLHSHRFRAGVLSLLVSALWLPAWAQQVAPEPPAAGVAEPGWHGGGSLLAGATTGNARTLSVLLNGELQHVTTLDKLTLNGMNHRASATVNQRDQTTAARYQYGAQYNRTLDSALLAFARLGLESDKLAGVARRVSGATGLGWGLLQSSSHQVTVYGGMGYALDHYLSPRTVDGQTDSRFERASVYVAQESVHKLSATTQMKQRLDLYAGVSGDRATLARFTSQLAVALTGHLHQTVGLSGAYNSKPIAGVRSTDVSLLTGLNLKF
ncbi:YdiY family protein [Roseateles sp. BYS180W]|uniref:YdiY family protein n=1 Tax=Roseateles rivi TaxID=3299028 RepID=A0ABW7FWP3_9BURK